MDKCPQMGCDHRKCSAQQDLERQVERLQEQVAEARRLLCEGSPISALDVLSVR